MPTTLTAKAEQPATFPMVFWAANFLELLERAAFYGFYISLTLYLTDLAGFDDRATGIVAGVFVGVLYFLTPFVGVVSDRMGFRRALVLAFALLTAGYAMLGLSAAKAMVMPALLVIAVGGAFIKPLVTGTIAKTVSEANRARGYALFYWLVNIGSFSGKTFVPFIRLGPGLKYVALFSAALSLVAFVCTLVWFRPEAKSAAGKTMPELTKALAKVLRTPRLILIILIVSGFWTIQYQLYATMPKYVIRLMGQASKPEWIANVNPLVVVLSVVLITRLMQRRKATTSIFIGMLLVPLAAALVALGGTLEKWTGPQISLFGLTTIHPMLLMLLLGVALQGLAECFISPRYLEYFSRQSPKGEEGTYLGFAYLYSFFAAIAGFVLSGFLLDKYCPDPKTLPAGLSPAERAVYYQHAHHIWYYFIGIGLLAALAFLVFARLTDRAPKTETTAA